MKTRVNAAEQEGGETKEKIIAWHPKNMLLHSHAISLYSQPFVTDTRLA